jgi:hypothetical protein
LSYKIAFRKSVRVLALSIFLGILFCVFPVSALSGVIVDDTVVLKGRKVMLRAETKGRLFSKGGEVVEFFVDGKSIGRTLSGGDGVAFKQFSPMNTGLHQISVRSGADEDTGLLLSLKRGSCVVFVDVEGSLIEGLFPPRPRQGSQKAIEEIHKRFPIVFLRTRFVSVKAVKELLEDYGFIRLPVVKWREGAIFDEIAEEGLRIKAIIAAPRVIESVKGLKPLAFSFESVKDAEEVEGWEEISRKVR